MSDIPAMPDDFWPEECVVSAKYCGHQLGFALTSKANADNQFVEMANYLRFALWQAAHAPPDTRDFATIRQDLKTA